MALPEISTGYKPEFGLGALYQGMNAANANQAAELEILKQFLANQREQQMQPIDIAQADQNLLAGMYKTDPKYQQGMTDMIEGQGMSNLAAGQTAKGLQQFKQAAGQAELEKQQNQDNLLKTMFGGVNTSQDQTKSDNERIAGLQQSIGLADTLSEVDPKFIQQKKLLQLRGDETLEQINTRAAMKFKEDQEKRNDPKYKEQLAAAFKVVADPNATAQQRYEAEMFIHLDRQSRLASNPAAYTPKMDLPAMTNGKVINQPTPVTQETRPMPPTGQPKTTLTPEQRAALIQQLQGK